MEYALGFPAEVQLTTGEIIDLTRHAERSGLNAVWVAEGRGGEALATLAALLVSTTRIQVGAGVLPVFNRSPWLVAMGASVLDELGAGRFVLGLGPGHRSVVEDRHGLRYERPVSRMRETAEIVRIALRGGGVDYDGTVFTIRGAQLSHPARDGAVPLHLAATGPGTLRLAGQIADGVMLILTTPATAAAAVGAVRTAAADTGRDPEGITATTYVFTCVHDDRDRARDASRQTLAYYGRLAHYQQVYTAAGFGGEARDIDTAWTAGRADRARDAVTDDMIDAFTASGNRRDVAAALGRFRDSGLDQVAAYPYPAIGQSTHHAFAATIDAVAPLVASATTGTPAGRCPPGAGRAECAQPRPHPLGPAQARPARRGPGPAPP